MDNAGWRGGAAALKCADLQRDDTQTRAMRTGGGARGMNCGRGREQGGDRSEHRVGEVSARGRRLDIEGESKHRQSLEYQSWAGYKIAARGGIVCDVGDEAPALGIAVELAALAPTHVSNV